MALDVKISFSWTNYCRLCLLDNGIMLPLFEEEGQNRQLVHKIETCFQLVTYDGDPLPRRICHKCLYKVNQTYEFRSMALNSYERLKSHLLPLKHVPEVQQYLERADGLRKHIDFGAGFSAHCSTPSTASARSDNVSANPAKIRIKAERDLMEDTGCSPWPSSTSMSHLDSSDQDSPFSSTSYNSSPVTSSVTQTKEPNVTSVSSSVQLDSLKRKRCLATDMASGIISSDASESPAVPLMMKGNKKKKIAGPASRKSLTQNLQGPAPQKSITHNMPGPKSQKMRLLNTPGPASRKKLVQNTQWQCVFCSSSFGSKMTLSLHLEKCLKCSTCQTEFTSIAEKAVHEAKEHIVVFIDSAKKHLRKRCSRCPARYASSLMLAMHSKYDHNTAKAEPLSAEEDRKIPTSCQYIAHEGPKENGSCDSPRGELLSTGTDTDEDYPLSDYKDIIKDHQSGRSWKCFKCTKVFSCSLTLENHDCDCSKLASHFCDLCNESFPGAHVLQEHEKVIHGRYRCAVCNVCFDSQHACNSHKRSHMNKSKSSKGPEKDDSILKKLLTSSEKKKMLSCNTCFDEFENEDDFILHLYKHAIEQSDDESQPKKKSRKNQNISKKSAPVSNKVEAENLTEQFSVKCERCHVVCRSKEYYKVHLATHVSKAKTSFPCSGCKQDFRNVEALNRHTCSGWSEDMQTCCLDCGQALVKGEDHVCDNKCPECEKVFKSSRGQRLHFVSKHRSKVHTDNVCFDDLGLDDNPAEQEEELIDQGEKEESPAEQEEEHNDQREKEESPTEQTVETESSSCISDFEANSSVGESPPKERLPPDGAPVDEPPTCQLMSASKDNDSPSLSRSNLDTDTEQSDSENHEQSGAGKLQCYTPANNETFNMENKCVDKLMNSVLSY